VVLALFGKEGEMPLPYQGNPGVFNYNGNPTLIPADYNAVVNSSGGMDIKSPAQFVIDNPRTAATLTATISGTITNADKVTMTLTQPQLPNGKLSVTHTVITSETIQDIAESLASQMNSAIQAVSRGLASNIWCTTGYDSVAHEAVVTVNWAGPMGNSAYLTGNVIGTSETITIAGMATAAATVTVTITTGTSVAPGDVLEVTISNPGLSTMPQTATYTVAASDTTVTNVATGLVNVINTSPGMAENFIYASNAAGVVTISQPGTIGNTSVVTTAKSVGATETLTLGNSGTLANGTGAVTSVLTGGAGVIFAANNFTFSYGLNTMAFQYGKAYLVDSVLAGTLALQDMPVV
jgi:hypothetical protein